MQAFLIPHPAHPPGAAYVVNAAIDRERRRLHEQYLLFVVEGDAAGLVLPAPAEPCRTDGLWQTTCFELFIDDGDRGYREFNLSPSGQWAAYRFRDYRGEREPLDLDEPPRIRMWHEPFVGIMLSAFLYVEIAADARIGLSAVIEEKEGGKSYWALAHPPGDPDFHHPSCFALELPAAERP